jgi:hypothetical protein
VLDRLIGWLQWWRYRPLPHVANDCCGRKHRGCERIGVTDGLVFRCRSILTKLLPTGTDLG